MIHNTGALSQMVNTRFFFKFLELFLQRFPKTKSKCFQVCNRKLLNLVILSVVLVHTSLTQNVSYALNIASSLKTLTANRAIWLDLFWPKMDINLTIISFDGAPTFCHNKLLPYEFGWVYSTEQKNTTTTKSVGMSETPLHNGA